jgi:hypothetical protein
VPLKLSPLLVAPHFLKPHRRCSSAPSPTTLLLPIEPRWGTSHPWPLLRPSLAAVADGEPPLHQQGYTCEGWDLIKT